MKKWIFLLLLIPCIALAGFGVDTVSDPAGVDTVSSPAGVEGVTAAVGDGLIGSTGHSGNSATLYHASGYYYQIMTTTTAGNVSYGHFYTTNGNSLDICITLASSDGSTIHLSGSGSAGSTNHWVNISMGGSYEIQAATSYAIAVYVVDSGNVTTKDDAPTGSNLYDSGTVTCGSTAMDIPGTNSSANIPIVFDNQSGDPS